MGMVYSEVEPFEGWKRKTPEALVVRFTLVYSEVEPFEGWKQASDCQTGEHREKSIARSNPLRDGNKT